MAHGAALGLGLMTKVMKANWGLYGKRAGYVRNAAMLDEGPELVIAFWDDESKGTQHTIREATNRGIPVEIIRDPNMTYDGLESLET